MKTLYDLFTNIYYHLLTIFQLSSPIRPEAIHFVFSSWIFDTAWAMIKPLLPAIVKDRTYFHPEDMESLHAHIEPKYLPKRYGGIHPDYTMDIWVDDIILKNPKCYKEFMGLGYDISVLIEDKEEAEKLTKGKQTCDKIENVN